MKTQSTSRFATRPSAVTAFGPALVAAITLFTTAPRAPAQTGWGTALQFDGVDDFVLLAGAALPTPWTAEFLVNRQDSPDASALLLGDSLD